MDIKSYLKTAYDYTYWANQRYFSVAEGLTEQQLHQVQGHSWGDVHGTLVHMMSSEWDWMQRWHGASPKGHLEQADFPTLPSLKKRWSEVEAEMRAFIESHGEEELQAVVTYNNFRNETF